MTLVTIGGKHDSMCDSREIRTSMECESTVTSSRNLRKWHLVNAITSEMGVVILPEVLIEEPRGTTKSSLLRYLNVGDIQGLRGRHRFHDCT